MDKPAAVRCTERQWYDLWVAFDKTRFKDEERETVEVKIDRQALESVIADLAQADQRPPADLTPIQPRKNAKFVEVNRARLWVLLRDVSAVYTQWESQGLRMIP